MRRVANGGELGLAVRVVVEALRVVLAFPRDMVPSGSLERLTLGELRRNDPGHEIGRTARRHRDDELNRMRRVTGFRTCRIGPDKGHDHE